MSTATEWARLVYDHPQCDACDDPADWIRLSPDGVIERLCDDDYAALEGDG